MANPVWGMLAKSQTDNETIEEAIARIVAEHEADEEAHLGVGDSLQSHKASEIIDHLASSIIADKLENKAVTVDKLDWDKFLVQTNFESVDCWQKNTSGAYSTISSMLGELKMEVGSSTTDFVVLSSFLVSTPVANNRNPFFQITVQWENDANADCDWEVIFGQVNGPYFTNGGFGFKWDDGLGKLYAGYRDSSQHLIEIAGIDPSTPITLRAECIYDSTADAGEEYTLKFYVNGVLEETVAGINMAHSGTSLFCIDHRSFKTTTSYTWPLYASNLIISMDEAS